MSCLRKHQKHKETREGLLFLAGDPGWNALPYLVKPKRGPAVQTQEEMCSLFKCLDVLFKCWGDSLWRIVTV